MLTTPNHIFLLNFKISITTSSKMFLFLTHPIVSQIYLISIKDNVYEYKEIMMIFTTDFLSLISPR